MGVDLCPPKTDLDLCPPMTELDPCLQMMGFSVGKVVCTREHSGESGQDQVAVLRHLEAYSQIASVEVGKSETVYQ